MSVSFEINSSSKSYQVEIGRGQLKSGLYAPKQNFVLVDELVLELYPYLDTDFLIVIPAVEESKSLATVAYVIEKLRLLGANRNSHLIAIGGGIIQDIATFTASIFMRGISWSYYPTTLLGMVDSCIGGKSSINVGQFKNIAGNFYPPERILIDTDFCETLKQQELISGLCEAVKICFASRDEVLTKYLSFTESNGLVNEANLPDIINLSLMTKKKFIEEDEFDTPELREAKAHWKQENPGDTLKRQRTLFDRGEITELPWMKYLKPVNNSFGTQFPENPSKGDTFVKTDRVPTLVYKFNGNEWIEVDKNVADSYTYDTAYIDHLISKIETGEYDSDLLSDAEREQVTARLQSTLK